MAEKLPPVMPLTYRPKSSAMEISGGRTKVNGSTIMMPVEIVIPGIMPTTRPNKHPTAVAARVAARVAWVNPAIMSGFIRLNPPKFPQVAGSETLRGTRRRPAV